MQSALYLLSEVGTADLTRKVACVKCNYNLVLITSNGV